MDANHPFNSYRRFLRRSFTIKPMNEWLKNNASTLVITVAGIVATFAVYGYRIDTIEQAQQQQQIRIQALEVQNTQTAVAVVAIQKDIEYIRIKLDKIAP